MKGHGPLSELVITMQWTLPKLPPRHTRRGYTVVELMIVIVVLAIAAMIVIPVTSHDVVQVRAAAQMLAADIAFAQVESIGRSDDRITIVFDTAQQRYYLAHQSDTATPIDDPVSKAPYRVQFGVGQAQALSDVRLHAINLDGGSELPFNRFGGIDKPGPLTVTLSAGDAKVMVRVDPVSGETSLVEVP